MWLLKKNEVIDFFTITLPAFLLGLNYVLYNALMEDTFKQPLRIIAILLAIFGWFLRGKMVVNKAQITFISIIFVEAIINGLSVLNIAAAGVFAICTGTDVHRDEKRLFAVNVLLVGLVFLLIRLGIVQNYSYISTMGRLRSTLGFENPNVAALFYSSAIYLYVISRNRIQISNILIAMILDLVVYYYTDSRTSFFALLIFMSLLLFMKSIKAHVIAKACKFIIDIFFAFNLLSVFIIDKFIKYDYLLSGRISTYARMIELSDSKVFLLGGTTVTADSFYYMFLFTYGFFAYVIFAIIVHFGVEKLILNKCYKEVSFITSFFALGLMESSIIRLEIIAVLLVWKLAFQRGINSNGISANID